MKIVKGMGREPRECFLLEDGRHLVPKGIFFIKRIQGKQLSFCFNLIPSQLPYRPTSVSNYTYVALHFHLSTSGKLHFCHKTFPPHRISLDYAQSLLFRKICRVPCRTLGVRCTKSRYWIPPPLWNKCTIEFFFLSTEPWTYAHSRSAKQLYFYNKDTHESTYEIPRDSVASFK